MRNNILLAFLFLLSLAVLPAMASAELMIVYHQFTVNSSDMENSPQSFMIQAGNETFPVQLLDWDVNGKGILISVNGTMVPLSRGWGTQVADMYIKKDVHVKIGLTHLFTGKPVKFARLCLAIWS